MRIDTSRWTLLLIPLVAAATGCGGGEEPEPVADTQPGQAPAAAVDTPAATGDTVGGDLAQQGRQIFTSNGLCFSCHGPDATGTPLGPDLTDGDWIWVDPAGGDMLTQVATIVRTGVSVPQEYPGPMLPMGGGQLSDDQIQAVATYVLSLNPGG